MVTVLHGFIVYIITDDIYKDIWKQGLMFMNWIDYFIKEKIKK